MKNSKIEWTHHTFNPWIGCTKVSPACDDCYAARSTPARTLKVAWGPGQPRRRTSEAMWKEPLKWNAEAQRLGVRYRVFCASLADVFDNEVPDEWRIDLFRLIAKTPNLDWLLLTKRIGNAKLMLGDVRGLADEYLNPFPWPNVWLGATICNQEEADRDIPKLLATPAAKWFLSMEPLLEPVNLGAFFWTCCGNMLPGNDYGELGREPDHCCCNPDVRDALHWVIVGGESGPKARPMHPDWVRDLFVQCRAAGVPFFFKQWGEWFPRSCWEDVPHLRLPDDECVGWPDSATLINVADETFHRVGKKAAGRLLDGRTWDEVPA